LAVPKATAPGINFRLFCRAAACIFIVVITGCRSWLPESPQALYDHASNLYRTEHFAEALKLSAQGIESAKPEAELYWRFRILHAAIILGRREAKQAQTALDFKLPLVAANARNQARVLLCQGFASALLHENDDANRFLAEAASLAQSADDGELLAEIQNRQGYVAVGEGQGAAGAALFHKALDYASAHHVQWLALAATGNVGYQLMASFHYAEAAPWLEKAAHLARQSGAVESEGRNVGNLGWCNYRIGEVDKALQAFEQVSAVFGRTGNRSEQQNWLGNIGSVYLLRQDYETAEKYYLRALTISRSLEDRASTAVWVTNLSRTSLDRNDLDSAERYNNEGRALKEELGLSTATTFNAINAARIAFARKQFDKAEGISREILSTVSDDPLPLLQARNELALALSAMAKDAPAETEFRACIREIDRQRNKFRDSDRRAYLASAIGFYEDYVRFLMDRGRSREALEVAESSHAMTLRDQLRLNRPTGPAARAEEPRHAADFQRLATLSGSTFLTYFLGTEKSFLWVITPSTVQAFTLPPASELRRSVTAWDRAIQDLRDPLAAHNEAGAALSRALIAPALSLIGKAGRVTIVPDGFLYSLNFETLPISGETTPVETTPGERPHYWIEDVEISVAPSLGLLHAVGVRTGRRPASLLLIGAPSSPDPEFPALAFAPQEMDSVRRSLPDAEITAFQGAAATPGAWSAAQPGRFSLIHFAAHAAANSEEPLESAIILSRDTALPGSNFRLRAKDIVRTPVTAGLVTISACRSAGARIYSGEGLVGLASAFLQAGAHNVIAGLWDVNDESGARMMSRLYSGMAAGESPATALRNAKLDLIRAGGVYRKPWYWAPFQIFTTDSGT
jgi:CHAT domain-containing protein